MKILFFALFVIMHSTYAQDNCDMLPRLEERVERLRLTCGEVTVKCQAGGQFGLNAEEAVTKCDNNTWRDRNTCIGELTCEGVEVVKCSAGGQWGLTADETVKNCDNNTWRDRNTCISELSCQGRSVRKCSAGGQWGLTQEEAVTNCDNNTWRDRNTCLQELSCGES